MTQPFLTSFQSSRIFIGASSSSSSSVFILTFFLPVDSHRAIVILIQIPSNYFLIRSRILIKLPVKAAVAVGKNHEVLLMMMTASATSAATATTSGLTVVRVVVVVGFNLILCCFLAVSCPLIKFHTNCTKNRN